MDNKTPKYKLNKKATKELERRGISSEKGILLYQNKLSLGYINGKTLESSMNETNTRVKQR